MSDAAHTRAHSEWFQKLKRRVTPKPPPAPPPRAEEGPPAEYIRRWLDGIDPTDPVRRGLAARAARLSWELHEGDEALKALAAEAVERAGRERLDQVDRLGQDLLGGSKEPPSVLLRRLEATPQGCRWLLDRWIELIAALDLGRLWCPPDLRRLVRLLGKQPLEAAYDEELNAVLAAFDARFPGLATALFELCQSKMPPEQRQPWQALGPGPSDPKAFQEYLLDVLGRQLTRLRKRIERIERRLQSEPPKPTPAEPRVLQFQRLQLARSRELRQVLDLLRKARAAKPAARPPCVCTPPVKAAKASGDPPGPRAAQPRARRPIRVGRVDDGRRTPPPLMTHRQGEPVAAGHAPAQAKESNGRLPP